MKLIPRDTPLNYALMWKCGKCGKWNHEDANSCMRCALVKPILPFEAKSKQHFMRMIDTLIAYAQDNGLGTHAPVILRAILIAYLTETEGHLAAMCRAFGAIHNLYRRDGDRILNAKKEWVSQ